jgi:hypothetical protein
MKLSKRNLPIICAAGKRKLQSTINPCPCSPKSRKIKKYQDKVAQQADFEELLLVCSANGSQKKKYGYLQSIVCKYQKRGFNVERHHLEYRLELRAAGITRHNNVILPVMNVDDNNETVVSDLTEVTSPRHK